MTNRAGDDLSHRRLGPGESRGVVLRREIADERSHATLSPQRRQRLFQQCGLTRAGARDHADDTDAGLTETVAKRAGQRVIPLYRVSSDFDQAWNNAHAATSKATSSISLPRVTCGVGAPHTGQDIR